ADHAVDRYVFAQLASPIEPEFGDLTEALLLPPVHPEEEMATERLDQIGARDPAAAFLLERGVLVVEPRITHRQVIANCDGDADHEPARDGVLACVPRHRKADETGSRAIDDDIA